MKQVKATHQPCGGANKLHAVFLLTVVAALVTACSPTETGNAAISVDLALSARPAPTTIDTLQMTVDAVEMMPDGSCDTPPSAPVAITPQVIDLLAAKTQPVGLKLKEGLYCGVRSRSRPIDDSSADEPAAYSLVLEATSAGRTIVIRTKQPLSSEVFAEPGQAFVINPTRNFSLLLRYDAVQAALNAALAWVADNLGSNADTILIDDDSNSEALRLFLDTVTAQGAVSLHEDLDRDGLSDTVVDVPISNSRLVPSNVQTRIDLDAGQADLVVGDTADKRYWVFDTDTGRIIAYGSQDILVSASEEIRPAVSGLHQGVGFRLLPQLPPTGSDPAPAGQLAVFYVRNLDIREGYTLVGRGRHALVIIAAEQIVVGGALEASAEFLTGDIGPGPGGFLAGSGPGAGEAAADSSAGGGGGAFGSAGGDGAGTGAGSGGSTYGNAALIPLYGGSGGGRGRDFGDGDPQGLGGHGGGALQLSAGAAISVTTGSINVGGSGGNDSGSSTQGAGGGGAGGAVLIEAPQVSIQGFVGANGGGGGAASPCCKGANGRAAVAPALGSRNGGDGSDAEGLTTAASGGGGGGGGAGRVRINSESGSEDYAGRVLPRATTLFTQGRILRGN